MKRWKVKVYRRLEVLKYLPNPTRRFQFLRIFLFMLTVPWLLRLRLPRLEALLNSEQKKQLGDDWDVSEVESIICNTNRALRIGWPFVHSFCLSRGITLYYFLRKAGMNVGLDFGVSELGDEPLAGHCWLVWAGEPLAEPVDPRQIYVTTFRFPEGQRSNSAANA
jgi:hypothetical protein